MSKHVITLTGNTTGTFVCNLIKPRDYYCWFATIVAQGTFGGGTVAWFFSIDQGTTLLPINDLTGVAITQTSNGGVNATFGSGSANGDAPQIYVKLTGATSPSITVAVLDNQN